MSSPEPNPATPPGRYPKGVAQRQEILDRATEVFAQRGAKHTSLRAIAAEVGVTHAALTHYFRSLEELLVAVYRESAHRLDGKTAIPDHESPAEMMRASAQENRAVPGLVQLYSTLVAAALEDGHPAAQEFATSRFAALRDDLTRRVARLQSAERLRADVEPALVAALVIAASDGLQTQWLLDDSVDHEAALLDPQRVGQLVTAMMDGLQLQWLLDPEAVDMVGLFEDFLHLLDIPLRRMPRARADPRVHTRGPHEG